MKTSDNRHELAADTQHGVYVCENAAARNDGNAGIVLYDEDFVEALGHVKDGETIYGNVSDDIAEQIINEYGIY